MDLEKKLERLEDKVDRLTELYHTQNVTLERLTVVMEKNTDSLITHEKRTTIAEQKLDSFELKFEKHLSFIHGAFWLVSGVVALIAAVNQLLDFLQKS